MTPGHYNDSQQNSIQDATNFLCSIMDNHTGHGYIKPKMLQKEHRNESLLMRLVIESPEILMACTTTSTFQGDCISTFQFAVSLV
jgi:hypothetical protein